MARKRRPRPYVNLRAGGNDLPTMANFAAPGGPRITTFDASGRPVRETVTGNELDVLPQVRGLRIRRNIRTNYGVRDLVVDQQGNVVTAIRGGSNPRLMMSTPQAGQPRRLVVGRGSATTGGGAAPTTPGADTYTYGFKPNETTLNTRFGVGGYDLKQVGGKWVVTRKTAAPASPAGPPDPYADYNDYPFIKNYLSGLDRQYDSFQNYVTNTYNPAVTAASQALTQLRLNSGNAYNSAVQNYAGSAGQVASAITTPQVAGMTGGTVQAPNQNALGAAQSMAATRNVARSLDAGYRTALGGLEAEKMGQSCLSSTRGYAAGLLNQYGQKRQAERLKMDQWIAEQKAAEKEAKDKQELELMKMDARMINALIASGDRAAARDVTAANNAADNARADAAANDQYTNRGLERDGWIRLPKGAGTRGLNIITSTEGVKYYKPRGSGGGGSGGGSGGSSNTTIRDLSSLTSGFYSGWVGKPKDSLVINGVTIDAGTGGPKWANDKIGGAANFLYANIKAGKFPGAKKGKLQGVRDFLNTIPELAKAPRTIDLIISRVNAKF